jgi:hypothetical protein
LIAPPTRPIRIEFLPVEPFVVDAPGAAEFLKISLRELARLDDELRPARLGKSGKLRRYPLDELRAYVEAKRSPK